MGPALVCTCSPGGYCRCRRLACPSYVWCDSVTFEMVMATSTPRTTCSSPGLHDVEGVCEGIADGDGQVVCLHSIKVVDVAAAHDPEQRPSERALSPSPSPQHRRPHGPPERSLIACGSSTIARRMCCQKAPGPYQPQGVVHNPQSLSRRGIVLCQCLMGCRAVLGWEALSRTRQPWTRLESIAMSPTGCVSNLEHRHPNHGRLSAKVKRGVNGGTTPPQLEIQQPQPRH